MLNDDGVVFVDGVAAGKKGIYDDVRVYDIKNRKKISIGTDR